MAVQIQLRRDTAANWTSADPTLAAGEFAIETDTDPPNSGQDNLQSMAMLEAAYLSAAENRIVDWAEMRIQS